MRLAEPEMLERDPGAVGVPPVRRPAMLAGWGGGERVPAEVVSAADVATLRTAVTGCGRDGVGGRGGRGGSGGRGGRPGAIARGMGRSYGDAAQLRGGLVLDTTGLCAYEIDQAAGTVTAGAGATIGELLGVLGASGWTLPVVPGTQNVSVGGAIASDVHGKNHASAGSFGRHVEALGLLTAAGELVELAPGDPGGWFAATVGGMGLTGVIVWARIRLVALPSSAVSVCTHRVGGLEAALAALSVPGGAHRVAWLDLLGPRPARGIVTRASPLVAGADRDAAADATSVRARASVPPRWPGAVLRPGLVAAYNDLRYRRAPRRETGRVEPFGRHMFPLDALDHWPRLYGRAGLIQYQLAVPHGREDTIEAVVARLRRSPVPCYLAVLKDLGPAGGAPLSFPIEGWTLALDMPRSAPGLELLLSGFDQLVAGAGGRVYLTKDARLSPEMLTAMYPRLAEWRAIRDATDPDGLWRSDLGLRTGLVGPRA